MQTEVQTAKTIPLEGSSPNWIANTSVLWKHRKSLLKTAVVGSVISLLLVLLIPKRYESTARIMPPESSSGSAAMLAALAGRGTGELGTLGSLAASMLGVRTSGPLFVDLLRSSSVSGHLIDRFELQKVYHTRYRVDTAKRLGHMTSVVEDKKSGVISINVEDADPRRARDLVQGYLDELNLLVNRTNTSSAHQERVFIEFRLHSAEAELEEAQKEMSDFSSTHTTIDIKEQTRATVDAAAKLQAQLIVEQSDLDSLKQLYGDENFRIRAARARIVELTRQLKAIGGSSEPLQADGTIAPGSSGTLDRIGADYPPLRQLPRLAVPYANIYRRVRTQEAVFEMLTQQYELARIQEAKEIPIVRVIDAPGIPEKKSFPPRALLAILLSGLILVGAAARILARERWGAMNSGDPRKRLFQQIAVDLAVHKQQIKRSLEHKG
jgi:capsule polysaccharide export protein KpsE/RkpR